MKKIILNINKIISDYFFRFLSIKDLRAKPDSTLTIIEKPCELSIDLSRYHIKSTAYWESFSVLKSDPIFYAEIANPILINKGIMLNASKEVLLESTIFQKEYLNKLDSNHFILFRKLLPKIKTTKFIPLLNKLDSNYYHWNMETLLRVLLVYEKEDFKDYKLVMKKGSSKFMMESLQFLFQIPAYQILYKGVVSKVVADKALVVSFPHIRNESTNNTNVYYPFIIKNINQLAQERLLENAFVNVSKYGKNILISRKNASERRMVNELTLVKKMEAHEVSIVLLEELSFIEQVALFSQVEKVIAIHGAGLTNLLYATNLSLLEFFPKERNIRDAFYFAQITAALQLEHKVIEYTSVNEQQDLNVDDAYIKEVNDFLMEA